MFVRGHRVKITGNDNSIPGKRGVRHHHPIGFIGRIESSGLHTSIVYAGGTRQIVSNFHLESLGFANNEDALGILKEDF